MIPVRQQRFWTSLSIIALCVFTASQAAKLANYGLREPTIGGVNAGEELGPFLEDPAVGYLARAKVVEKGRGEDSARRPEELRDLLAATPLSSEAWLDLARARLQGGASADKVASALTMSTLTGPNEAWLMASRASFGLPLWPILPPEAHKALISDLIGGWEATQDSDRQGLRALFSLTEGETREETRAALLLSGKKGTSVAKMLGMD